MHLQYGFQSKNIIAEGRTTPEAIKLIKDWIESSPLPALQDEFIVLFLIACLNDVEAAKKRIEAFFRVKSKNTHIFNGPDVETEEHQKIIKISSFCVIPKRIDDNHLVVLARLNDSDYRKCDIVPMIRLAIMLLHWFQQNDPPNEIIILVDINQVGFMHLTCLKLRTVLAFLEFVQEAVPIKIRRIHVLNANYIFSRILTMFQAFIKNSYYQLIKIYPRGFCMEELHQEVPSSHLPKDYGGDLPLMDEMKDKLVEGMKKLKPFFEAEEKLISLYDK